MNKLPISMTALLIALATVGTATDAHAILFYPPGYWETRTYAGDTIGTADWGAGYSGSTKLAATPAWSLTDYKHKLELKADLSTHAILNGLTYQMFAVRVNGVSTVAERSDLSITAYLGTAAIFTKAYAGTSSTTVPISLLDSSWPKTFVTKSYSFFVGPVPVTLTAKAVGTLRAKLSGAISSRGFQVVATPSGDASLHGTAGTGFEYCAFSQCVGAVAGVYVDLTLVEASLPMTLKVLAQPSGGGTALSWANTVDFTLSSLDGELGLEAWAVLDPVFNKHWQKPLLSWDSGFKATWRLAGASGGQCLAGSCIIQVAL